VGGSPFPYSRKRPPPGRGLDQAGHRWRRSVLPWSIMNPGAVNELHAEQQCYAQDLLGIALGLDQHRGDHGHSRTVVGGPGTTAQKAGIQEAAGGPGPTAARAAAQAGGAGPADLFAVDQVLPQEQGSTTQTGLLTGKDARIESVDHARRQLHRLEPCRGWRSSADVVIPVTFALLLISGAARYWFTAARRLPS
jgi:hypothetical protein